MTDSKKILVVDDEPDIVRMLSLLLKRAGYEVVTASNADEGLQKVREEQPDLIVLDVMMPGSTEGFHFAWTLRNDKSSGCADVPIIVHSAVHDTTSLRFYPDQSDGTYGPGEFLPVQDFLDKPADPAELLRKVQNLLAT